MAFPRHPALPLATEPRRRRRPKKPVWIEPEFLDDPADWLLAHPEGAIYGGLTAAATAACLLGGCGALAVGAETVSAPVTAAAPVVAAGVRRFGNALQRFGSRATNLLQSGVRAISRGRGCPGCACFLPGTHVQMADGTTKPIEDVREGDWIVAHEPTGEIQQARFRVVANHQNSTKRVIAIEVVDRLGREGALDATGEHPFWTQTDGWVSADELHAGDRLVNHLGETVTVESVAARSLETPTFNLTVEGVHTYFVVSNGVSVLVHNQPRIHGVAPDWGVKGAHVTASNGIEIAIRGGGRTPVYRAVFSSDMRTAAGRPRVAAAIEEVRAAMANPQWRNRLLARTRAATEMLGRGKSAVDRAGSGGTRALEVTLRRMGCP